MLEAEKKYIRNLCGGKVLFTSSQIADSYLQDRIASNEVFEFDGKKLSLEDIFCHDEIVRSRIQKERPGLKYLFPPSNEEGFSIRKRMELFWRIVLRGDDSLISFILEQDAAKAKIAALELDKKNLQTDMSLLRSRDLFMLSSCRNVHTELRYLTSIVEFEQKRIMQDKDSFPELSGHIDVLKSLTESFSESIQKRVSSFSDPDNMPLDSEVSRQISMIDEFQRISKKEFENEQAAFKQKMMQEYDELENNRRIQQQEINKKRDELNREIEAFESQKRAHEKFANDERSKIADAYQKLNADQETANNLIARNREEMKLAFERKKSELEKTIAAEREENYQKTQKILQEKENIAYENCITFSKSLFSSIEKTTSRCICLSLALKDQVYNTIVPYIPGDVSRDSLIAFYDCSLFRNKTCGILVTIEKVYFIISGSKCIHIRMEDVCANNIHVKKTKSLSMSSIILGAIAGIIAAIKFSEIKVGLVTLILVLFFFPKKKYVIIQSRNSTPIASFGTYNKNNLIPFCDNINRVAQNLRNLVY